MTRPDKIDRLIQLDPSETGSGFPLPDHIARLAQDFEAMNAPQIRRDRWREWRPVVLLIVGLALAALALHVWPVAAGHVVAPFAGKPY